MSINCILPFVLNFIADGTSTTLTASFSESPFLYYSSGGALVGFDVLELVPTGVNDLAVQEDYSGTVSGSIVDLGSAVQFTFDPAPEAGTYVLQGNFIY